MRTRTHDIHLRQNDKEYSALMKNCGKCGLDHQTYLRFMCLNMQPKEAPSADLKEYLEELRKIGTNINQVALMANKKGVIDRSKYNANYMRLLDEINKLRMEIYMPEWVYEEVQKEKAKTFKEERN